MPLYDANKQGVDAGAQIIVMAPEGYDRSKLPHGGIKRAYKDFCRQKGSMTYFVKHYDLGDGTKVRCETNTGQDRIMVWPPGVEPEEGIFMYGSPRFFPNFKNGDPSGREVYRYVAPGKGNLRLSKSRVFSPKTVGEDEFSSLDQQPGNRTWLDTREIGRQFKHTVSWWARNPHKNGDGPDRRDRLDVTPAVDGTDGPYFNKDTPWQVLSSMRFVYIDGKPVIKFPLADNEVLLGAALAMKEDGVYVRAVARVLVSPDHVEQSSILRTWEARIGSGVADILTAVSLQSDLSIRPSATSEVPLANDFIGSVAFNSSATKFCFIACASSGNNESKVVEIDFDSFAIAESFTSTIEKTSIVTSGCPFPAAQFYPTGQRTIKDSASVVDYGHGPRWADQVFTTTTAIPAGPPGNYALSGTYSYTFSYEDTRSGTYVRTTTWVEEFPVACDYTDDQLVVIQQKTTYTNASTISFTASGEAKQTMTAPWSLGFTIPHTTLQGGEYISPGATTTTVDVFAMSTTSSGSADVSATVELVHISGAVQTSLGSLQHTELTLSITASTPSISGAWHNEQALKQNMTVNATSAGIGTIGKAVVLAADARMKTGVLGLSTCSINNETVIDPTLSIRFFSPSGIQVITEKAYTPGAAMVALRSSGGVGELGWASLNPSFAFSLVTMPWPPKGAFTATLDADPDVAASRSALATGTTSTTANLSGQSYRGRPRAVSPNMASAIRKRAPWVAFFSGTVVPGVTPNYGWDLIQDITSVIQDGWFPGVDFDDLSPNLDDWTTLYAGVNGDDAYGASACFHAVFSDADPPEPPDLFDDSATVTDGTDELSSGDRLWISSPIIILPKDMV